MHKQQSDPAELLRHLGTPAVTRPELLRQALTHSSFAEASNERLEFLGDAVLKLAISHWLYEQYPHYDEGKLSALRAYLVSDQTLARIGSSLNLGDYLYMSHAEHRSGGRTKSSLMACALEAVFGALYLSEGLDRAREIILKLLADAMAQSEEKVKENYKDRLQVWTQQHLAGSLPTYEIVATEGPTNNRQFYCQVKVDGRSCGQGKGRSKRAAEQQAARQALALLAQDSQPPELYQESSKGI